MAGERVMASTTAELSSHGRKQAWHEPVEACAPQPALPRLHLSAPSQATAAMPTLPPHGDQEFLLGKTFKTKRKTMEPSYQFWTAHHTYGAMSFLPSFLLKILME